jgi:hypothetical protein
MRHGYVRAPNKPICVPHVDEHLAATHSGWYFACHAADH